MSDAGRKNPGRRPKAGWVFVVTVAALAALTGATGQAAPAGHLLLAEIQTFNREQAGTISSEFIEVVNPTAATIDLSDVYLVDATYAPGSQFYWRIAEGDPSGATAGGGAFNDFHARFPQGYTIAPGDTVVVSIEGSSKYLHAYGRLPDLELFEDGTAPDQVPEMREAFPGAIAAGLGGGSNVPNLSDASESLVLYTWNGTSDLVQDLDFAFWGASTSVLFDKTGVTVGTGTYQADTAVASQQAISAATLTLGQSYMRDDAGEGTEKTSGGNGLTGHDETSENLGTTWGVAPVQAPARQPAAFFKSAPIITAGSSLPAAPIAGQQVTLSLTALSYSALSGVTFYVAYDRGAFNPVTGTSAGGGTYTATLPGQIQNTHVAWYAVATNSDGGQDVHPALGEASPLSWVVTAEPLPSNDPDKLLLTEICTLGTPQEFVEIYNPNSHAVDMSDYYLTDSVHSSNMYWMITQPNPGPPNVGGGLFNDFYARFPSGFTIAAGDTIVVSIPGSSFFEASYGFKPELELYEDDGLADEVQDMLPLWGDSVDGSIRTPGVDPTLTNGGEGVVLLHWDGTSPLVTDIDVFNWKDPTYTSSSFLFDKTGVTVAGSTYGPDTPPASQTPFAVQLAFGNSYQRVDVTEGAQSGTTGNGVDGRNETSEDFNNTFAMLPVDPSPPGVTNPLAPVVTSYGISPAEPGSGQAVTLTVTAESPTPLTTVDFYYSVSGGEFVMLAGAGSGGGTYSAVVPGQDYGTEMAWYAVLSNEGGFTAKLPPAAPGATLGWIVGAEPVGLVVLPRTFIPTEGEKFPIRFNSRPNSETRLRIFDLEGRLVYTLFDSRFDGEPSVDPGKYTATTWDGRDDSFERVKAGMYILHLSIVGIDSGVEETKTAPVVVATRLSN